MLAQLHDAVGYVFQLQHAMIKSDHLLRQTGEVSPAMHLLHVFHYEEGSKVSRNAIIRAAVNYLNALRDGIVMILLHHALDPYCLACQHMLRVGSRHTCIAHSALSISKCSELYLYCRSSVFPCAHRS